MAGEGDAGATGRTAGATVGPAATAAPSMNPKMSCFVTRPANPVPVTAEISRLCSAAILRTRGVERRRSRSSAVSSPSPPFPTGAAAAAAVTGTAPPGAAGARWAGAEGGEGAGAVTAAAPFSVSMTPTRVCTATVCPSCTLISASTPATGDGISASTLSVEISNSGSSRLTSSPTFLSHLLTVPSAIDSPIWGMRTSIRAIASPKVSGAESQVLGARG